MGERRITMDGAVNFRDIGGYPAGPGRRTRWRTIYRSDSLAELSPADLDRLRALGLYALSDFRLQSERLKKPDQLPVGHAIQVLTPGFIPEGTDELLHRVSKGKIDVEGIRAAFVHHYSIFAAQHLGNYASTLRMILQADGAPVLLHCTSGKDRTGFGIALLMLIAGCDEQTIAADYLLTNEYRRDIGFMFRDDVDPRSIAMLTSARPEYIGQALDTLRNQHGSPDDWLAALGFDAPDRAQLRALLTEPAKA